MSLELIPSNSKYASDYLRWRSSELARKFNPIVDLSLGQAKERLTNGGYGYENIFDYKELIWIIMLDEQALGTVSLKDMNAMMNTAEIGYFVDDDHHGKGLGSEAVKLFISEIFSNTPLRRLIASVHEDHIASRKVLEKNSFQLEGIFREHFIINGNPVNEAYYGLLKSEWLSSH